MGVYATALRGIDGIGQRLAGKSAAEPATFTVRRVGA